MPKCINPPDFLGTFAENVLEYSKCEEKDVCQYVCDLFKGILHQSTIRRNLPNKYKLPKDQQYREKGRFA